MEDRQLQVLLEQADVQRRLGNYRGSIELLQRALALDPDHARAHGALALSLLGARRLPGAQIEMRAALHLDGNDPWVHYVAAAVLRASRDLQAAWEHCLVALEDPTADAATHVLAARVCLLQNDRPRARELLEEALALEATHVAALTVLAGMEMEEGQLAEAAARAEVALRTDPVDHDAHVMAGHIALAQGDVTAAEGHARFVLTQDANDEGGLQLWTAIRARKSRVLGVWWRWNTWMSMRDDTRAIAVLIAMFVVVRIFIIVLDELGYEAAAELLGYLWLGICAYTWFAPAMFRSWMKKELGAVKLDPDF